MGHDPSVRVPAPAGLSIRPFTCLFQPVSDGVLFTTLEEGRILDINAAGLRVLGYTRRELIGRTTREIGLWLDPAERHDMIGRLRRTGHYRARDVRMRAKSGAILWASLSADVITIQGQRLVLSVGRDVTAQREAADALRRTEEKFKTVFRASPDMIAVTSQKDGRYMDVNAAYCRGTGHSRRDLIGKRVQDFHVWRRSEDRRRMLRELRRSGRLRDFEMMSGPSSKPPRWYSVAAAPIAIGGEPCILSIVRDLTERRAAEQDRLYGERKFRLMLQAVSKLILEVDRRGSIRTVYPTRGAVHGFIPRRAVGRPLARFCHPADRSVLRRLLHPPARPMPITLLELRLRHGPAGWVWMEAQSFAIVPPDGERRILVVARDITERRNAQAALLKANRQFLDVLDHMDAVVYVADLKTYELLFVNRRARRVLGVRDPTGRACWKTLQRGQRGPCPFCTNDRLLEPDGTPTPGVLWEFRNTVTGRWYECRDRAIPWADGRWVHLEIAIDITDRKQLEEQRRTLLRRLITAQETERQSISAALHDQLGQLLSMARMQVHALPAPDARSRGLRAGALERLSQAVTSIRSLARTLRPPLLDEFGLTPAIQGLVDDMASLNGLTIRFTHKGPEPALDAPRQVCLFRVLQEALLNALRHGRARRIAVTLDTRPARTTLRIRDNGHGFRVSSAAFTRGIGLRGMQERLEQFGGRLALESRPGHGTQVTAILPPAAPNGSSR